MDPERKIMRRRVVTLAAILLSLKSALGFLPLEAPVIQKSRSDFASRGLTFLFYSRDDNGIDSFDTDILSQRIQHLKLTIMEESIRRPPNSDLTSEQFVRGVMSGLLDPFDPLPDAGFRLLLRSSTKAWRCAILQSIGAKEDADPEVVASALGAAIGRPNNQFAILVGEGADYDLDFSSEPVDFDDGICWVECRLRDKRDGRLLTIIGWNLIQRDGDGAWLVNSIEWQDFRDEFRPGVGREEWMRLCG
jgi:hypothetical protein